MKDAVELQVRNPALLGDPSRKHRLATTAVPNDCDAAHIGKDDGVEYGSAIIVEGLDTLALSSTRQPIYDQEFGIASLHQDAASGAEHYLIRYPAGMKALSHRHTAAHTIVVLEGAMEANGRMLRAPSYCHFPGGELMHHAPAGDCGCLFVLIFDGPFDVQPVS